MRLPSTELLADGPALRYHFVHRLIKLYVHILGRHEHLLRLPHQWLTFLEELLGLSELLCSSPEAIAPELLLRIRF